MFRLTSAIVSNIRSSRGKYITQSRQLSNKVQLSEEQQQESDKKPVESKRPRYDSKIVKRVQKKLPPRQPLLKNIAIGNVDTTMMAFPEVIPRDDMQRLQTEIQEIRQYFQEKLNIEKIRNTQVVGKEEKDEISNLGLYGFNVPQHLGGRGYTCSEDLLATEPETISADISTMLASHRLVVDMVQKYGTQEQIEKFLPVLADGSAVATDAIYERVVPEDTLFNTKAMYDDMDKQWLLKGQKMFVVNGNDAKFFLVLAETNVLNMAGEKTPGVTLFMVDGDLPGIRRSANIFPLGCKGTEFSTITFDNVRVNEDCVLGKVNVGSEIALSLLKFHRIRMSLVTLGLMKNIIANLSEHCITTKQAGIPLKDMDIAGYRLSGLVCKAYALESMIYYIAGLIDEFDNQDVDLEVASTKLYSLDCLHAAVKAPVDFMGPASLLSDQPTHKHIADAIQLSTHGESRDSLNLYTGLSALQYAGMNIHEIVKKERNPLMHPAYMFKKLLERKTLNDARVRWRLNEELHPSLDLPSKCLEQSIARLKLSVEILLTRYGTEIIQKHIDVARISEMLSLVLAMFATLSRASRSHCIGLRHSDYEILLSITICVDANNRIQQLMSEIENGSHRNNDRNYLRIAKQIYKSNGFFLENPTTYNF